MYENRAFMSANRRIYAFSRLLVSVDISSVRRH